MTDTTGSATESVAVKSPENEENSLNDSLEEIVDQGATENGRAKGKEKAVDEEKSVSTDQPAQQAWQAIWSPQHSAYYFFNSVTQETTWANPLQSEAPSSEPADLEPPSSSAEAQPAAMSSSTSAVMSKYAAMQAAAAAQGIDPSLAYLDPSLASGVSGAASSIPNATFTAKFNARTGAFAKQDARDPTHLSEFERAKRMSEFYFDVGAWENEVADRKRQEAEEEANGGRKRKRPTKKDLERFKEQKKQKKIAKTAWLRS